METKNTPVNKIPVSKLCTNAGIIEIKQEKDSVANPKTSASPTIIPVNKRTMPVNRSASPTIPKGIYIGDSSINIKIDDLERGFLLSPNSINSPVAISSGDANFDNAISSLSASLK